MIPAAGPGHWNDPDMVRHFMQLFLRKDNFYDWIIVIIFFAANDFIYFFSLL